jgi:hypothetical protein
VKELLKLVQDKLQEAEDLLVEAINVEGDTTFYRMVAKYEQQQLCFVEVFIRSDHWELWQDGHLKVCGNREEIQRWLKENTI